MVAVGPYEPLKFFDVTKKMWQTFGKKVPVNETCLAVTSFGNYIYVGGLQTVHRYSIDSNAWDKLPAMRANKGGNYQLIVLGEHLYAIGNHPERYSFREKTWQRISAEGISKTSAAAVLNGCIYAVDDSVTQIFDACKNLWVKKTNNLCRRRLGYAFIYNDKLIIAGGKFKDEHGNWAAAKTVEVYCEKNDCWSEVTQTHVDPGDVTFAFEAENTIFLKLRNLMFDTGIQVSPNEPFPVNLDEWRNVTASVDSFSAITYAPVNLNKELGDTEESS